LAIIRRDEIKSLATAITQVGDSQSRLCQSIVVKAKSAPLRQIVNVVPLGLNIKRIRLIHVVQVLRLQKATPRLLLSTFHVGAEESIK
jgi:hypothetical protein